MTLLGVLAYYLRVWWRVAGDRLGFRPYEPGEAVDLEELVLLAGPWLRGAEPGVRHVQVRHGSGGVLVLSLDRYGGVAIYAGSQCLAYTHVHEPDWREVGRGERG